MPSRGSDLPCGIRWLLSGGSTRTVRGGRVGGGILYLASEEGCLPLGLREVQCGLEKSFGILSWLVSHKSPYFFAFFGPKFNYQSWKLGQFFCASTRACFYVWCTSLCEVGRCRTSFQGAQDRCVKESVNILINILINICKY